MLPQPGAMEQECKDGLSSSTGMEPAGTRTHPAPASSHVVMNEGQEPSLAVSWGGGGDVLRALSLSGRGGGAG
jgi:hypothetical protein